MSPPWKQAERRLCFLERVPTRWFGVLAQRHCPNSPDMCTLEVSQLLDACSPHFPTDLTRGFYLHLGLRTGHMTLVS